MWWPVWIWKWAGLWVKKEDQLVPKHISCLERKFENENSTLRKRTYFAIGDLMKDDFFYPSARRSGPGSPHTDHASIVAHAVQQLTQPSQNM